MRLGWAAAISVVLSLGTICAVRAQEQGAEAGAEPAAEEPALDPADGAAPQDTGNAAAIDDFLNNTNAGNVKEKVDGFYARDARYEDPFGTIEGRNALLDYYKGLFGGVETLAFDVKEVFVSGDETVALWTLRLQHKSLKGGEAISLDGVSQFRFAGNQVVFQHNYFDAGALVYEHVTFVGMLVRWVKKQILPQ